jgi:hypothetical protein
VSQSALLVHDGRHPIQSGFVVPVTHVPLQQSPSLAQLPARFVHGFWHADAGAHSLSPVSFRSVQQPVSQSESVAHGTKQALLVGDRAVHRSPSQQAVSLHDACSAAHSPAAAAGPYLHSGYPAPAGPVQKHDAWSNVMQA